MIESIIMNLILIGVAWGLICLSIQLRTYKTTFLTGAFCFVANAVVWPITVSYFIYKILVDGELDFTKYTCLKWDEY